MIDTGFQITLSSNEILILAALLGYESVFGIEEKVFSDENTDLKTLIHQHIQKLEQDKLIRYDLDGTLYIVSALRQAVDCICTADTVGLFSTNLKSGKKASVYIMEKESFVTTLMDWDHELYQIHLSDSIPLQDILPQEILTSKQCQMKEMMLFEEAERVHSLIESFNYDDAENQLKKHIQDDTASGLIAKILTGNCGYASIQIHKKGPKLYNSAYNSLLVTVDDSTISLRSDENDVLFFEAQSPSWIVDHIHSHFTSRQKRGTD